MAFTDRAFLERYLGAMQEVVDRHDILRTAFLWKDLLEPVQVVHRKAPLSVSEIVLDPRDGPIAEQLKARFDPRRPPSTCPSRRCCASSSPSIPSTTDGCCCSCSTT